MTTTGSRLGVYCPGNGTGEPWRLALLVLLIGGFLLASAALLPIHFLYFYDEGVYSLSALRLAEGDQPYTDFYLAHPPGVAWMSAVVFKAGGNLIACRFCYWLLAIAFAGLLYVFMRRLQGDVLYARLVACLTVLFLVATSQYRDAATQVLTQLPGMLLMLAGFLFLLPGSLRPIAAGVLLAAATVFRIQFAYIGPAWVASLLATYGWSAARGPIVRLTVMSMAFSIAFHGIMELTHPHYLDCIIRSHIVRPKTPFGEKFDIMEGLFLEPQMPLGLVAAAILTVGTRGPIRGLGIFVIVEMLLTLLASRFLEVYYFQPTMPFLLGCGAILVGRVAEGMGNWRPILAAALVVVAIASVPLVRVTRYRWTTQRTFEQDLIARVRAIPGNKVACTPGKIALFAGKRLPNDYHCPDTTSPIWRDFGAWFISLAQEADLIVITDEAVRPLTPANCAAIRATGKPIIFGTPGEEADFRRLESQVER